jgi:hypothetical protein
MEGKVSGSKDVIELFDCLCAMREELEQMDGYWTERMDTLAQWADELIQRHSGESAHSPFGRV